MCPLGAAMLLMTLAGGQQVKACDANTFPADGTEHMTVEVEKAFRVRTVTGTVSSQGGEWPEGVDVLVELQSATGSGAAGTLSTRADRQGRFAIPGVAPGRYCLKVSARGWQSVVGTVVVTNREKASRAVRVTLPLGV